MNPRTNNLELLNSNSQLLNLSKFIVHENFNHHTNGKVSTEYKKDIESIYFEEMRYFQNAKIYLSKDESGEITGSIRTLLWNHTDTLPIQKIFNINPLDFIENPTSKVWHIGRFAIRKDVTDRNLFKRLMVCAIHPICKNKGSIAFAECDSKLLRVMSLLGIETNVVGKPIGYLGSETIPIGMTTDGLLKFYKANKMLVSPSLLNKESILFVRNHKRAKNYNLG